MLKVFGILVLTVSALVFLVGAAGAVMNFVFPPDEMSCKFADEEFLKAQKAVKEYEAAKGTPEETTKKLAAEYALTSSESWSDSCARSKDSHRFYGMIFAGVGFVGLIGFFFGAILTIVGFRKKKIA